MNEKLRERDIKPYERLRNFMVQLNFMKTVSLFEKHFSYFCHENKESFSRLEYVIQKQHEIDSNI